MSTEDRFASEQSARPPTRVFETEALWQRTRSQSADQDTSPMVAAFEEVFALYERFGDARNGTGLPDSFVDSLDRIDRKDLKTEDQCAICSQEYLEDPYPLVVVLPCPGKHTFDLECIGPWLKGNSTCPLCRYDMSKKKEIVIEADDEEEDYDDMYG